MSSVTALDLYRGLNHPENVQRAVLRGEETTLHPKVVEKIKSIGIVAPKGLRAPIRCKCGGLIIAVPCVFCQITGND
jgi:hypothetical protein